MGEVPGNAVWVTMRVQGIPTEILREAKSGKPLRMARLKVPLAPLRQGHCANCGGVRKPTVSLFAHGDAIDPSPKCQECGVSLRADHKFHLNMARRFQSEDHLEAAERAAGQGHKVLALKLVTAAWHWGPDPELARSMRLDRLRDLGEEELGEREARDWFNEEDAPAWVASLLVDLLLRRGDQDQAASVLDEGIERDPRDRTLRLERAELLEEQGQWVDATEDAIAVLGRNDRLSREAMCIVQRLTHAWLQDGEPEKAHKVFQLAAPESHRDAQMCYLRGCIEQARARNAEVRRWMIHALTLDPNHQLAAVELDRVEAEMNIASTTNLRRAR
jgi:tetratricopeptide (TPR) repeat protein